MARSRHTFVSRASKRPNLDGWKAYFRLAETRASSRTSTSGFAPVRCSSSTGNAASEIADKLLKFDFARSFAGPHFAINLKAAKSVSLCRRIFASVHESAFVPCLPSRAPVVYGSYQGISCRQRRLSTAAEDDPKRPFALARLLVGRRRHQISKALLIAIGSDFDLLAMLK